MHLLRGITKIIMDIKLFDLMKEVPTWVHDKFYETLDDLAQSDKLLAKNYTRDRIKLHKMLTFDVLTDMDKRDIICFGGLQINSWPDFNMGRVSSRHYFSPRYKYIHRHHYNWEYCVVNQIQAGLAEGIDRFFFSTEHEAFHKVFDRACVNATRALNKKIPNVVVKPCEGYYNVTPLSESWQRVGQIIIDNKEWDIELEKKWNLNE